MTTIKQESYKNLPNKYRTQHGQFEIIDAGMGEALVAKSRYNYRFDLLEDMGVLDVFQVGNAVYFVACKEAALGKKGGKEPHPDQATQLDVYYKLVATMAKKQFTTISLACEPLEPNENIMALRSALYALAPQILYAFDVLDIKISEIRACK